ncbi:hypothetical protein OLZ32_08025 [Rhizobium sp. 1AS11]|uniref:hypothetical protein n=1 Tax=Rhizobium acaciae TaxID=2989736 RepID=UPI00222258FD|nr:hypothetical protein [Rhizobium acaciae]MCW1408208.1 hypothetical protein [Rhizobium acaciae]MCW1740359.1 hypothetical protein [Rhizobium acaciae]
MERTLRVTIDRNTWPKPPALPAFPAAFNPTMDNWDVSVPALLLTIGYLTTPSHASGVSLSEFWAWVRYLHAVSGSPELLLTRAFHELDAHQKTILSDDFGMGAPIAWLIEKLNLTHVADGRYFIQRMATQVGVQPTTPKKRGPGKSPDFVARDASGVWHVLECKGTQTSGAYRAHQLGSGGRTPTGAVAQKRTIVFPHGYTGQRLASGLFIGVENGGVQSSLHLIDPEPEEPFEVRADDMVFADDAIARAATARALRLAGFPQASSAVSAPTGVSPASRPTVGRHETDRLATVEEKRDRAEYELKHRGDRDRFIAEGEYYRGRKVEISLPTPLNVGHRTVSSLIVRYGVGTSFLDQLREFPLTDDPIQERITALDELQKRTTLAGDKTGARLQIGTSFVADISFRN